MKRILIPVLVLCSSMAQAKTLHVQYQLKTYELTFESERVALKAVDLDLSIYKRKCTEKILQKFHQSLDKNLNSETQIRDNHLLVKNLKTTSRRYFAYLPEEFKRMKVEETLRCRK